MAQGLDQWLLVSLGRRHDLYDLEHAITPRFLFVLHPKMLFAALIHRDTNMVPRSNSRLSSVGFITYVYKTLITYNS